MMASPGHRPLVLASSSARRVDLLRQLTSSFEVVPSTVDERAIEATFAEPNPIELASCLAEAKAAEVASERPETIVIGADTVVTIDGLILGKPVDRDDAFRMIDVLQGRTHSVVTAVEIRKQGQIQRSTMTSYVTMRELTRDEIETYVSTDESLDKAGAYAVQGHAGRFIERVNGCYLAVVGLPLCVVATILSEFGMEWHVDPVRLCDQVAQRLRDHQEPSHAGYGVSSHPVL